MLHHTLQLEIVGQRASERIAHATRHRAIRAALSPRGTSPSLAVRTGDRLARRGRAAGDIRLAVAPAGS